MKTTDQLYEELRAVIDNGNESMTHEDALEHVRTLQESVETLDRIAASRRSKSCSAPWANT